MKLHTIAFTAMVVLIAKGLFGFTWITGNGPDGNTGTLLAIWGGALLAFVIGAIAYSFDWDKRNGQTSMRDATTILGAFFLVTKFPLIVGFVVALGFTIANW